MKSFTKSLFTYLVIAFVAISCGGSDNPSPAKNCKLVKYSYIDANNTKITQTYTYGNNGKVSKLIDVIINNTGTYTTTTSFIYDTSGKLTTRNIVGNSGDASVEQIIYKPNGQIEKIKQSYTPINGTIRTSEVLYEYGTNGKIYKEKYPTNATNTYDYDTNGNLISYNYTSGSFVSINTYGDYDGKKNYASSLADAFPTNPQYQSLSNYTTASSPNGGNPKFIYTYNSKDFPTKMVISNPQGSGATITFEYTDCE
jgi:hypothetical protein